MTEGQSLALSHASELLSRISFAAVNQSAALRKTGAYTPESIQDSTEWILRCLQAAQTQIHVAGGGTPYGKSQIIGPRPELVPIQKRITALAQAAE